MTPLTESERLKILQRYAILDTPPEAAFDRIASLAARLFQVPVALVTLVDTNRQWFKACYGTDLRETSRDVSFCSHAILRDEIMIVPDATQDERFANNPLVTGDFGLRFYAGVPLRGVNGAKLGTLCLIDTRPRELDAEQQAVLLDLAEITMDEFRLRLAHLENNQLSTAVFNVASGVVVTDPRQPDNPIVFCNPAFCEMTGYVPEEILGWNCRFLQGEGTDPALRRELNDSLREQRTFRGLMLNYRKDRTPFWNDLVISPVFDPDGRLMNYVGLQVDVTARKNAEDALRESYEKLRALEKLRDNLTNMIIHDLRSPLSVTIGFLDLLKSETEGQLSREANEAIHFAEEGAHQIKDMVTSLLDVSRLESGDMPLEMRRQDLTVLTQNSLAHRLALHGSLRLKLEFPREPLFVSCDAGLINRVINNLVGNALKFTPVPGEVSVVAARRGADVLLSVMDTGPGIPPADHARIFEKFGQVKGTKQAHSTGLGLTFCKLAVEAQGGVIGVESKPGKGSTFWFSLPAIA